MALAIWVGASVEHVRFNHWIPIGLLGAALLAAIIRMIRRASILSLRGSPMLALWLAVRFLVTPAVILIGLAWLICWGFALAPQAALLNALALVAYWGGAAILATSALADLAAALKGPAKAG